MKTLCLTIGMAALIATAGHASRTPLQDTSRGCDLYKSGVAFLADRKYEEALADFQKVLASCPQVEVKAQALLKQGYIYLSQSPPRYAEARKVADTISGQFVDTSSGPDGLILLGLIELREGRGFEAALNQFTRVGRINALGPSRAEAEFWAGETLRIAHRPQEALRQFQTVTLRYPAMDWKARALLGSASAYVQMGEMGPAMEALQRVRRDFPGSREADLALKRNTILHRLTMRGPQQASQPPAALGPGRLRDGVGLVLDAAGRVIVGYRDGVAILPSAAATAFQPSPLGATDPSASAVGLGPGGILALARQRFLALDKEKVEYWSPEVPQREGNPEPVEVMSFLTNWNGEWLIGDDKSDAILRFSAAGTYVSPFAENVPARRMIRNDIDDIAVVNDRTRGITIFARDGGAPREIPRRVQATYEWDNASDIAFDSLGNLYVLDGGKGVIHAFDPRLRFLTTIQLAREAPVQLRKAHALVVDESGRFYVLDRDGQQVLAYR